MQPNVVRPGVGIWGNGAEPLYACVWTPEMLFAEEGGGRWDVFWTRSRLRGSALNGGLGRGSFFEYRLSVCLALPISMSFFLCRFVRR